MPREHSKGKQPSVEPGDYEEEEDYNDYTYNGPKNAWIAVPEYGPVHTPRGWGNTHDVEGLRQWPIGRLQPTTIGVLIRAALIIIEYILYLRL